eukprot:1095889-Amphidinium_carterae.2
MAFTRPGEASKTATVKRIDCYLAASLKCLDVVVRMQTDEKQQTTSLDRKSLRVVVACFAKPVAKSSMCVLLEGGQPKVP